MKNNKRIVIVGATSAIAEHCARLWIRNQAAHIILIGRDTNRVKRVATDLKVRNALTTIEMIQAEFLDPTSIQATVDSILSQGKVDIVLIAHGSLPHQTECQNSLQTCRDALEINSLSPVMFAEAFANGLARFNYGTIAVIGSVAGDRGRKSNYVYGSAKGLVTRYVQGLQHRFAGTGLKIVLIKPGPTDTPMTAHLKDEGTRLAPVNEVAERIVNAVQNGRTTVYVPGKWQLIMWIIKHLPRSVFNKLNI